MSVGLVMPKATFGKDRRLLNAYDFKQVFNNNSVRLAHPKLLILAKPNSLSTARLGLVIAKKKCTYLSCSQPPEAGSERILSHNHYSRPC